MQVAVTGEAFKVLGHWSEERPTLCKLRKGWATPNCSVLSLRGNL